MLTDKRSALFDTSVTSLSYLNKRTVTTVAEGSAKWCFLLGKPRPFTLGNFPYSILSGLLRLRQQNTISGFYRVLEFCSALKENAEEKCGFEGKRRSDQRFANRTALTRPDATD